MNKKKIIQKIKLLTKFWYILHSTYLNFENKKNKKKTSKMADEIYPNFFNISKIQNYLIFLPHAQQSILIWLF